MVAPKGLTKESNCRCCRLTHPCHRRRYCHHSLPRPRGRRRCRCHHCMRSCRRRRRPRPPLPPPPRTAAPPPSAPPLSIVTPRIASLHSPCANRCPRAAFPSSLLALPITLSGSRPHIALLIPSPNPSSRRLHATLLELSITPPGRHLFVVLLTLTITLSGSHPHSALFAPLPSCHHPAHQVTAVTPPSSCRRPCTVVASVTHIAPCSPALPPLRLAYTVSCLLLTSGSRQHLPLVALAGSLGRAHALPGSPLPSTQVPSA